MRLEGIFVLVDESNLASDEGQGPACSVPMMEIIRCSTLSVEEFALFAVCGRR